MNWNVEDSSKSLKFEHSNVSVCPSHEIIIVAEQTEESIDVSVLGIIIFHLRLNHGHPSTDI